MEQPKPPPITPNSICPFCGEIVLPIALKCKHCGEFFDQSSKKVQREDQFQKSRGTYIIIGILGGILGLHNFYAGRIWQGAGQLTMIVVLGWCGLGIVINIVWVICDLCSVFKDGEGRDMRM